MKRNREFQQEDLFDMILPDNFFQPQISALDSDSELVNKRNQEQNLKKLIIPEVISIDFSKQAQ